MWRNKNIHVDSKTRVINVVWERKFILRALNALFADIIVCLVVSKENQCFQFN